MTLAATTSTDKSLKDFDELMITLIEFSGYILNGLEIENLTQEILLGPAFRLLKGTRSNYVELEYAFEECYKAFSEKLHWENLEGSDYPFDLSKPLPFITRGNCQRIKAAKYDLPGIEDIVPNIWSPVNVAYDRYAFGGDVYFTKHILAVTHVKVVRKQGYGYLEEIVVRRADNILYRFKEDQISEKGTRTLQYKDPQGFIYVDDYKRNRLMRSDELKFSDGTLTRLLSSLEDITNNIDMEYLTKRRWSNLEKKRAHFMIKDINKLLKERRMMRSLEKFIGGRLYGTDLGLLQRTI
ncbi:hypothetical protein Tco_1292919 [Tanacetum coccineum]